MTNQTDSYNLHNDLKQYLVSGNNAIFAEGLSEQNHEELDGISILVEMAKQGKVDPWNIDIVDITDKYLSHILQMKSCNLRLTGRTLLFAAILLRLKSNILEDVDSSQFEESYEEYDDQYDENYENDLDTEEEYLPTNNVVSIDEVLQRRTSVRLNRNRVVTLKDLIRQLKFYEELDKKSNLKEKLEKVSQRRVKSYAKFTADDIINLAHDEYIEKSVEIIHQNLIKLFEHNAKIELSSLVKLGMDKISAYIALLFLSVNENISLVQNEFYGEVFVVQENGVQNES